MTTPDYETTEQIILDSSSISIKGIQFRVILTNYRIVLYNSSTQKQNDIALSEVQKVKAESGPFGNPTILLSILSQSGENRNMIFIFSPDHENERNQWITEINILILSNSKISSNGIGVSPVNSCVINQQSDTFFCSRCGNKVPVGSSFCNRCGTKISPPAQPIVNYQNTGNGKYAGDSAKISTEKIQFPDTNIPLRKKNGFYIPPVDNVNTSLIKQNTFGLDKKNTAISATAICCGGLILLLIIGGIASSLNSNSSSHSLTPATEHSTSTPTPTVIPTEEPIITKDLKSLALTNEDLPSGWMEVEKTVGSNNINKQFLFSVGTTGAVFDYNITKFNSIGTAKTGYSKIHDELSNMEIISMDLGDEAFGYTQGTRTYFVSRYRNIITEISVDTYPPLKISTLQTMGSLGLRKMKVS